MVALARWADMSALCPILAPPRKTLTLLQQFHMRDMFCPAFGPDVSEISLHCCADLGQGCVARSRLPTGRGAEPVPVPAWVHMEVPVPARSIV